MYLFSSSPHIFIHPFQSDFYTHRQTYEDAFEDNQ